MKIFIFLKMVLFSTTGFAGEGTVMKPKEEMKKQHQAKGKKSSQGLRKGKGGP